MAVYTEVSDEALRAFLAGYDVGEPVACKGIAEGVENSNFLLDTERAGRPGRYILTLYEKRVAREDLPFFLGLMDHLAERDFPCPRPVRDWRGAALGACAGRPAAMVTFLPGTWSAEAPPARMEQVGAAAARFHRLAADFPLARANALAPAGWPPLAERCLARADEVEGGLADLIERELAWLAPRWPTGLPAGPIHADLFPDNVFFLHDALSGVIDFYFACTDAHAYELAIALNAWCFRDGRLDGARADALLRGYESERALTAAEREALPVLARGAALRFLLTRTVDWLDVPPGALVKPHDPRAFSARLRAWQQGALEAA